MVVRLKSLAVIAVLACAGLPLAPETMPGASADADSPSEAVVAAVVDTPPPQPEKAEAQPDPDPIGCFPVEPVGDLDEPPTPAALKFYVLQVAARLRVSGRPIDLAVSNLVADLHNWYLDERAAQTGAAARAAILSTDPSLYGLALMACDRMSHGESFVAGAESCSQLSRGQHLLLEPDNAWLWLSEASDSKEPMVTSAAVYRASVAGRFDPPALLAARTAFAALQPDDPVELRYALLYQMMKELRSAGAQEALWEAESLSAPCNDTAVLDPNRRQMCERIAHGLLDHPVEARALWTGLAVAVALGWSEGSLATSVRRAREMSQAMDLLPTPGETACGAGPAGLTILTATLAPDSPEALAAPAAAQALGTVARHRARAVPKKPAAAAEAAEPASTPAAPDRPDPPDAPDSSPR